jgi:hypothetical protein
MGVLLIVPGCFVCEASENGISFKNELPTKILSRTCRICVFFVVFFAAA